MTVAVQAAPRSATPGPSSASGLPADLISHHVITYV